MSYFDGPGETTPKATALARTLANNPSLRQLAGPQQPSFTPAQSIIPDPTVYQAETAQALQAYQQALAAIGARRANTLQGYGMTAQVDSNGNLQHYGIDSNNQYGAIQQLLGQLGGQVTGLQHNAMDRGIGLRGLGAQAINQARFQGGAAQQQLGQQFVGEIGQEAQDQYAATSGYNNAKLQAQRDAIASAIQNGYFTQAPMAGGAPQTPGVASGSGNLTSRATPQTRALATSVLGRAKPVKPQYNYTPNRGMAL